MITKVKIFEPEKHIDVNDQDFIQQYLQTMLEENGIEGLQRALGYIAKAKGMSKVASQTHLGRESLYKSLSENGKPKLETIDKVLKALGMTLAIQKQDSKINKKSLTSP